MLDCRANMPVSSQSFVDIHNIPGVLHRHADRRTMSDGSESATNAGRAYTHARTPRCGNQFSPEFFEISPLQSAPEIMLPW